MIPRPRHLDEPRLLRWCLIGTALTFLILFLFLPLVVVFTEALRKGLGGYLTAVTDPMAVQGSDEEEAALTLGASEWQTFFHVSLPKIKWGLIYGIVLCAARATGEFGAVSVVSGHIRGLTTTVPLHVEILYNEYQFAASFAVASLLTLLALATLVAKGVVEWRSGRRIG